MKRFALAGLLRVRELQEKQAAAELAEANHTLGLAGHRRSRTRAALGGTSASAVDAATLSAIVAARASTSILLGELTAVHERADAGAAQARSAHSDARVNARSLEKLHDRHLVSETRRELSVEQSALDEVAIQGWRTAKEHTE